MPTSQAIWYGLKPEQKRSCITSKIRFTGRGVFTRLGIFFQLQTEICEASGTNHVQTRSLITPLVTTHRRPIRPIPNMSKRKPPTPKVPTPTPEQKKGGCPFPALPRAASGEIHREGADGEPALTTNKGLVIADNQNSLKAGLGGPTLLENFVLREKITHFDHERIPERIVHACGTARNHSVPF